MVCEKLGYREPRWHAQVWFTVSVNEKPVSNERIIIRDFLSQLPKLLSHYCRASTSKEYLEPHFQSTADVYRLYCTHSEKQVASRHIFNDEFHKAKLGLHQPKQDQCDICCAHNVGSISDEVHADHVAKKEEARQSKANDKLFAADGKCEMVTMDVQAVQLVPQLQASSLYFKQKLAVHNFTFYNVETSDVVCYVWHEGEGEVTANVFTLCIVHFIENETTCTPIREILLYSDECGSQNRNVSLSNAFCQLAKKKGLTITQKYLERGHTQMECDSVHSVIERHKRNRELHAPADYVKLIKESGFSKSYKVHYIDHTF